MGLIFRINKLTHCFSSHIITFQIYILLGLTRLSLVDLAAVCGVTAIYIRNCTGTVKKQINNNSDMESKNSVCR